LHFPNSCGIMNHTKLNDGFQNNVPMEISAPHAPYHVHMRTIFDASLHCTSSLARRILFVDFLWFSNRLVSGIGNRRSVLLAICSGHLKCVCFAGRVCTVNVTTILGVWVALGAETLTDPGW
jgi:hypothetical protein